jgi:hypothetical protein
MLLLLLLLLLLLVLLLLLLGLYLLLAVVLQLRELLLVYRPAVHHAARARAVRLLRLLGLRLLLALVVKHGLLDGLRVREAGRVEVLRVHRKPRVPIAHGEGRAQAVGRERSSSARRGLGTVRAVEPQRRRRS